MKSMDNGDDGGEVLEDGLDNDKKEKAIEGVRLPVHVLQDAPLIVPRTRRHCADRAKLGIAD